LTPKATPQRAALGDHQPNSRSSPARLRFGRALPALFRLVTACRAARAEERGIVQPGTTQFQPAQVLAPLQVCSDNSSVVMS